MFLSILDIVCLFGAFLPVLVFGFGVAVFGVFCYLLFLVFWILIGWFFGGGFVFGTWFVAWGLLVDFVLVFECGLCNTTEWYFCCFLLFWFWVFWICFDSVCLR